MWKKNYSEIYNTINSFPSWPNHLKNIMNLISETIRQRVTTLISKAYSTISLTDASNLLGLSREDVLKLASQLKWTYEEDTGYILVPDPTDSSNKNKNLTVLSLDNGAKLLEKLSNYILFLENSTR